MEFPRFAGNDPTEWLNRISQYFEYQETTNEQKVVLAAYHLEGEANQWWQWMCKAYQEEGRPVMWETFVDELWACFGPTDCEKLMFEAHDTKMGGHSGVLRTFKCLSQQFY